MLTLRSLAGGATLAGFLCAMGASISLEVFDFADLRRCLASTITATPAVSAMVGETSIASWQRAWGGSFLHAPHAAHFMFPVRLLGR